MKKSMHIIGVALIAVAYIQGLQMKDTIFREYDIRGKVGEELCINETYQLGKAIAYFFKEQDPQLKTIAIGMDGRTHSPAIKQEIVRAFIDSGINVIFVGMCTTPVLYFALYNLPVDGGLMITASHNPKEYNGIKLCLHRASVWGLQVQAIKDSFKQNKAIIAEQKGEYSEYPLINQYVDWLCDHFKDIKNIDLSVVIDCGNGAAGTVLPQLIKKMGWRNISLLYPEVDGTYPNHEADPTKIKNMQDVQRILRHTDVAVGIGLDGDCDRMAAMTKKGYLIPGDELLAIFSNDILQRYPSAGIVFEIKSSQGLIDLLSKWGARWRMSPAGHAIVKDIMCKHDALIGGELSCHFFFKDEYFGYDDGIYAMMRLIKILGNTQKSLDELLSVFPKKVSTPEYLIACEESCKRDIVAAIRESFTQDNAAELITIDGVRASFDYGWGLVRASNTTPNLTVRFESDTDDGLLRVKKTFFDKLALHFDAHTLQQALHL